MANKIATIYLKGHGSQLRTIKCGGGREIRFLGGAAGVIDERDMPLVLRMPDVQVEVETPFLDQLPKWANQCPVGQPATAHVVPADPACNKLVGPAPEYELSDAPKPKPSAWKKP